LLIQEKYYYSILEKVGVTKEEEGYLPP